MKKKAKKKSSKSARRSKVVKSAKKKKAVKKTGSHLKIVNLKTLSKDRFALKSKAKKYAKGNLSAWLRHAGLKYIPKRGEKILDLVSYPAKRK